MVRALLRRKSTGEVLKRAHYPRVDLKPVVNLDADLEWVLYDSPTNVTHDNELEVVEITSVEESANVEENPELKRLVLTPTVKPKPLADAKLSLKELVLDVASFNSSVYAKQAVTALISGTPKATVLTALGNKFSQMFTAIENLRSNIDGATLEQLQTMKTNVENAREVVEQEVATPPIPE